MTPQTDIEIIQVSAKLDGTVKCTCTASKGKPVSMLFDSCRSAFAWLIGVVEGKSINLFVCKDLELSDEVAMIQMAMRPKFINLTSMANVSVQNIQPQYFQQIIQGPFRASKYTFAAITNVHKGSFCNRLLLSETFLNAQIIEIHISDFLSEVEFKMTMMSSDAVMHWFFNGKAEEGKKRYFIANCIPLDSNFMSQMIEAFKNETEPKPTTLVLYGENNEYRDFIEQNFQEINQIVVKNETTGEQLKIQCTSGGKVEFARVLEKADQLVH